MKQEYVQPAVAMLKFAASDVMAASGNNGGNGGGGNYRAQNNRAPRPSSQSGQRTKTQIDIAGYRK